MQFDYEILDRIELDRPMIIVFEGVDGSFKNTQANLLMDYIEENITSKVVMFQFPNYDSPSSHNLVDYFKSSKLYKSEDNVDIVISPLAETTLFVTDIFTTFYSKQELDNIRTFFNDNYIIIMDRYFYSNIYYQLAKRVISKMKHMPSGYLSSVKYKESQGIDFSIMKEMVKKLADGFLLPKADLIFKMHYKDTSVLKDTIEARAKEQTDRNDEINNGQYKMLDIANDILARSLLDEEQCLESKETDVVVDIQRMDMESSKIVYRTKEDINNEIVKVFLERIGQDEDTKEDTELNVHQGEE